VTRVLLHQAHKERAKIAKTNQSISLDKRLGTYYYNWISATFDNTTVLIQLPFAFIKTQHCSR